MADTPTLFTQFLRHHLPGQRFRKDILKQAGRILANKGEDATIAFLRGKSEESPPDFQPPVKCPIIACSRPLTEWPIYQASVAIQGYVYGQSLAEFEASDPGCSKDGLLGWFDKTGVCTDYFSVQGLNLIFQNARKRYIGVQTKVTNRNEKRHKKLKRINAKRIAEGLPELTSDEPESALDETGHLIDPPGLNTNIYCYQQVSPKPLALSEVNQLPTAYAGYSTSGDDPIQPMVTKDRLSISKGQPGYIPEHQRALLSQKKHRRMRGYGLKARALLVIVRIQDDWAVIDLRSLLRNAYWRRIVQTKEPSTITKLLKLVTGDPVLDATRMVATFTYKPGIVQVRSAKCLKNKQGSKLFSERYLNETVSVTSIDLGSNNLVAVATYRLVNGNTPELLQRFTLPSHLVKDFERYKQAHDTLEDSIQKTAVASLPQGQQTEIRMWSMYGFREAQERVCQELGLADGSIPWNVMTATSTILTDLFLARGGDPKKCMFTSEPKKKKNSKQVLYKIRDRAWAKMYRTLLSKETREAWNKALWGLKRGSPDYARLSKRKEELARRCVNYTISTAEKRAQCGRTIVALEDLNIGFFHGRGKQEPGWVGLFTRKKENRWLMQALHKAFLELAHHRGYHVIEVNPAYTSQTCPVCRHCDPDNRDQHNREAFHCIGCGFRGNADLDVATHNIAMVAITGESLKRARGSVASKTPQPLAAE